MTLRDKRNHFSSAIPWLCRTGIHVIKDIVQTIWRSIYTIYIKRVTSQSKKKRQGHKQLGILSKTSYTSGKAEPSVPGNFFVLQWHSCDKGRNEAQKGEKQFPIFHLLNAAVPTLVSDDELGSLCFSRHRHTLCKASS